LRHFLQSITQALVAGVLVVLPIYLAILLLLKAMKSLQKFARPLAHVLPAWFPGEAVASLLLVFMLCFLVGLALRTPVGRAAETSIENSLLQRIPGYPMFRSMTRQLAGESAENEWKAALVEIEHALVPAFIVEELDDGRFTVFVPSVPTPLAGAIYILDPDRVHPLSVSFTTALKAITRWGSGSKELVAAMRADQTPSLQPK
jgi:uncharacterized membrane protein